MHSFSTKLVKVGNSKGVILPKKALEQLEIDDDDIHVEINEEAIILRPSRKNIRKGWTKAFKKMHATGDDKPIAKDFFKEDSKDRKGAVMLDQIRTVDKRRLMDKIEKLTSKEILQIKKAIKEMLVD